MENQARFEIRLHPDAVEEYNKLDGSVLNIVNNAIDELEIRAYEVGKKLSNNNETKLAGCKEIKLRNAGVRIVFKVTNDVVHILTIVYIITIEKRDKGKAFKVAHERLAAIRKVSPERMIPYIKRLKKLTNER